MLSRTFISCIVATIAAAPRSFRSTCTSALCLALAAQSIQDTDAFFTNDDLQRWGNNARDTVLKAKQGIETFTDGATETFTDIIESDRAQFLAYLARTRAQLILKGVSDMATQLSEHYDDLYKNYELEKLNLATEEQESLNSTEEAAEVVPANEA